MERRRRPEDISIRLFDVLEMLGVSGHFSELSRTAAINTEIVRTIRLCYKDAELADLTKLNEREGCMTVAYIVGSFSEGTRCLGLTSGFDLLFSIPTPRVCEHITQAENEESLLLVKTDQAHVKLQLMINGVPQRMHPEEASNSLRPDRTGLACYVFGHVTAKEGETRKGSFIMSPGEPNKEISAIRCSIIPSIASQWVHRRRYFGWPEESMVSDMESLGCFLVQTCDENCEESELKWTVAFLLQEREMMFDLNSTQYKAFVHAKMIIHDVIEPAVGEKSIESTHCKTCLFHAMELSPEEVWKPKNLLLCVRRIFMFMYLFLLTGHCPNYFQYSLDMFENNVFKRKRQVLLKVLKLLLDSWGSLPFWTRTGNVFVLMGTNEVVPFVNIIDLITSTTSRYGTEIISFYLDMVKLYLCIPSIHDQYAYLENVLKKLQPLEVHGITPGKRSETKKAISCLIPFIHLRMALLSGVLAAKCSRSSQLLSIKRRIRYHQSMYFDTGVCEGQHIEATLLFNEGKCERSLELLDELGRRLGSELWEVCVCNGSMEYLIAVDGSDLNFMMNVYKNPCFLKHLTDVGLPCIVFSPSDITIVPKHLQYEFLRSESYKDIGIVSVNPGVYYHCLLYTVLSQIEQDTKTQQREVMTKLQNALEEGPRVFHIETAYNILGCMYMQEGRLDKAVTCWIRSLQIQPNYNAAKLHFVFLFYKHIVQHVTQHSVMLPHDRSALYSGRCRREEGIKTDILMDRKIE